MEEKWKLIEDEYFNRKYAISNYGRIKRLKIEYYIFGKNKIVKEEKIIEPKISNSGYYQIFITTNNKTKAFSVHRLVAKAFIKNPNNFKEIDHIDGNKLNNRVDNLNWVTHKENMQRWIKSDRYNKEYIKNKTIYGMMAKILVEQKPRLVRKHVFMYNGEEYDSVKDVYETHTDKFKNYKQCWNMCTYKIDKSYLSLI